MRLTNDSIQDLPRFVKRKFSIVLLLSSSPPSRKKTPPHARETRCEAGLAVERKERLPAQLIGQSGELGLAGGIQRAADRDGGGSVGQVLAALKHFGHDLGGHRRQEPFSIKATVRFW